MDPWLRHTLCVPISSSSTLRSHNFVNDSSFFWPLLSVCRVFFFFLIPSARDINWNLLLDLTAWMMGWDYSWSKLQFTWDSGNTNVTEMWTVWLHVESHVYAVVGRNLAWFREGQFWTQQTQPHTHHNSLYFTWWIWCSQLLFLPRLSTAFLPICILFSLHSTLAKLVGAKLSQQAVCLLALHLSSGCQLQFWSHLGFILYSCINSGINWSSMILYLSPLIFQSNILAATFSYHLFWVQITLKLLYSRLTYTDRMQLYYYQWKEKSHR